jgi:Ni,Fe-hydrogenase III small subunit
MWRLIGRALAEGPVTLPPPPASSEAMAELGGRVAEAARVRLGRSLSIRTVDAGSCNACELELQALCGPTYDIEHYGIRFTASPRQADVLLVTGPVTVNMAEALRRTLEAMPSPRWVVAVGDCARDGGLFAGGAGVMGGGVAAIVPVDLHISGCPAGPARLLAGLLALLQSAERPLAAARASG